MIPLLHDFTGTRVLVFGGGPVGARKARRFAREADVVVLSPAFAEADFADARLVRAAPGPEDVAAWIDRVDPALVVAATDREAVNAAIESVAGERGLLCNRTDAHGERDPGSVVVPATVRDDPVVLAVATGGLSPALSKHLRKRLAADLDGVGELAEITAETRARLKREGVPPEARHRALGDAVSSERVWKALDTSDANLRQVVSDVVSESIDESDRGDANDG